MASNVMGTNIKLVGEKEYRAALSQIGSALKQLQSELDLPFCRPRWSLRFFRFPPAKRCRWSARTVTGIRS